MKLKYKYKKRKFNFNAFCLLKDQPSLIAVNKLDTEIKQ